VVIIAIHAKRYTMVDIEIIMIYVVNDILLKNMNIDASIKLYIMVVAFIP
jgi:hypothetical protein